MRHDYEKATTETVALYVQDNQSGNALTGLPVASFYDAMTTDDPDRIIVIAESGETKEADPGCATVDVEVGIKSTFSQPTAATDISDHFSRVNSLRDLFNVADPASAIDGYSVTGITVTGCDTVRRFETVPDRDAGFIYSSIELTLHVTTTT